MIEAVKYLLLCPAVYMAPAVFSFVLFGMALFWRRKLLRRRVLVNKAVRQYGLAHSSYRKVHGGKSRDYFDSDLFLGNPANVELVVEWAERQLSSQQKEAGPIDRLIFLEKREGPVGLITSRDLFSWKTKIPSATVRLRRRGPAPRIKGLPRSLLVTPIEDGAKNVREFVRDGRAERVVLLSDVATTGSTILEGVELVKEAGAEVKLVLVLYDRMEGAEQLLARVGVRLVAMMRAESELHKTEKSVSLQDMNRFF